MKNVEGPVGPHLFRMSQDSTSREVDFYLSMSPPASPEEIRIAPPQSRRVSERVEHTPPRTSVPLRTWTPRQVAEWMYSIGFDRQIVDTFFINDISGITLIDLQYDDLKELGINSFGQRHRLWTEIRALKENKMATPEDEARPLFSPAAPPAEIYLDQHTVEAPKQCATPPSPEAEALSPTSGRRRRRRHPDDIISPAESASIVAIEQLLPKPHHCAKGENCSKWQKQQRKLAKIATEFPNEMAQIMQSKQSPTESGLGATSIVVPSTVAAPSIIASSDLLGPAKPSIRLEENALKTVQLRDPQDNVRQFLDFQHVNGKEEPESPPYEMFPSLSPPKAQAPHMYLKSLPKLTIPSGDHAAADAFSPARTAVPPRRGGTTPVTALDAHQRAMVHDMWRVGSPASEMDVPVTAIPLGPIERDVSSSVPPDMRYGGNAAIGISISRSSSRSGHRGPPISFNNFNYMPQHQQTYPPIKRSNSASAHRRQPSITISQTLVEEPENTPTEIDDGELTPTGEMPPEHLRDMNHHGYMKKRKTKLLRHEWQDAHFRLKGTQLAMHQDAETLSALEYIDVDDYAVAISANNSKLNSAMKRLHLNAKKPLDPAAFAFQLTPAAEKRGVMHAATGKTHHFAVKTATERIDWMRELMLARARKEKGAEVKSFD